MSTYIPDYAADAANHRRDARQNWRRARTHARQAARQYDFAGNMARHARWLAARPDMWDEPGTSQYGTPASWEKIADSAARSGDLLLALSFTDTERARWYAAIARRYDYRIKHGEFPPEPIPDTPKRRR